MNSKPYALFKTPLLWLTLLLGLNSIVVKADEVDDYLQAKMREQKIPGLQVAVIKDNKIIKTASYGVANIQDSVAVDNDTLFTINSITKAFTAVAVMQWVEQGKIKLSDPISDYLPDLPVKWHPITVAQLLSHASGLPNIMNADFELIDSDGESQSWKKVQQLPLLSEPGTQFHYHQTGYALLGKIIEKISGEHFDTLINQQQLQKVGMKRTAEAGFSHFQSVVNHRARGYTYYIDNQLTNVKTGLPAIIRPGVGMSSTAEEMAQWLIALQAGKLFAKSATLNTMWSPYQSDKANKPQGSPYALGWPLLQRQDHPAVVSTGGDRAALAVYPNDNLTIVVLTNLMGANPVNFIDDIAGLYIASMKKENGFGLTSSTKALWLALEHNGYDNPIEVAKTLSLEPKQSYEPGDLNELAYRLYIQGKKYQAQQVYRLNHQIFAAIQPQKKLLAGFVGDYEFPNFSLKVMAQDDILFMQLTDQKKNLLFARSNQRFDIKELNLKLTASFGQDSNGQVATLSFHFDNDEDLVGNKIK